MTRRDSLVGDVMTTVVGKKLPASTLYSGQRRYGALSPTIECSIRHWLDPCSRAKFSLSLKTRSPSERELVDKAVD